MSDVLKPELQAVVGACPISWEVRAINPDRPEGMTGVRMVSMPVADFIVEGGGPSGLWTLYQWAGVAGVAYLEAATGSLADVLGEAAAIAGLPA